MTELQLNPEYRHYPNQYLYNQRYYHYPNQLESILPVGNFHNYHLIHHYPHLTPREQCSWYTFELPRYPISHHYLNQYLDNLGLHPYRYP